MSDAIGACQCGQSPSSLFKPGNLSQGAGPSNAVDETSDRPGQTLADDKVTLSADAITIARAQLAANGGEAILQPTLSSSLNLYHQTGNAGNSLNPSQTNFPTPAKTTFHTRT